MRTPAAVALIVLTASIARAQGPVSISADTTVELSGATLEDQDVATDDGAGSVAPLFLGAPPDASDVDAYHEFANGHRLYSLDAGTELPGGLVVGAGDVVGFDGATATLEFDASAEGVPDGAGVDAVSVHGSGDLLLSFDTTVELGGGLIAADEDLVRFEGAGLYTAFFDGSAEGVPEALDLDGADFRVGDGHLFLSFDGGGVIAGVDFQDEDVLEFDPGGAAWVHFYDGAALHASFEAADVIAVPEPGAVVQLGPGVVALGALSRRRCRAGSRHDDPA